VESETERFVNFLAATFIEKVGQEIIPQREECAAGSCEDALENNVSQGRFKSPLVAVFMPSGQATRLKLAAETVIAKETMAKIDEAATISIKKR
jgi:hypothetical protein